MFLQEAECYSTFRKSVEKPVLNASLASIVVGTVIGAALVYLWLVDAIPKASLPGAVLAGAAVGANAGFLIFGVADVIFAGRLEEGANIVEDADASLENEELNDREEILDRELYDFSLPKAS